uniref:RING-type domain-containing protein n=2 Tax=Entomoneis paludosa TaxID=265537 RepID=A0A7S2Y952_9STRA|mmetsp:Transcript_2332/g.4877  ORF Transcript_2332/g.4877 Transcript_2332/m.4877 type:complete len:430 (+) Transcript_2332:251-1540(+)|eukprot:CAMPEP_0172456782 /NCGR_PEP_ID=MMETSP1065-20121228/17560_1 /TAXON_ID=265537 /ORGANISM="Amphiprora paludosa, Strain CCMP125" /LENGTH=429 /DNA_ID=CAMNT_0013210017 /DNA_START=203 /DNA_END=1492 /DNA_ORIENTATION=+
MSQNGEPNAETGIPSEIDMGYEEAAPGRRRNSMTVTQERERRASIKAILADDTLAPIEKRRSIQHLMDGRRSSMSGGSMASSVQPGFGDDDNNTIVSYGYDKDFAISNEQTKRTEESRPPCHHYERGCTIIAPCCGGAFGCRICHDDCPVLPPRISNAGQYHRSASLPSSFTIISESNCGDEHDTHHQIDRFAIREVICRQCYSRQPSKTIYCIECGLNFGEYHCNICNLWMGASERPYHCEECGFCRVGGAENFLHCDACGMCIDKTLYDSHNCKDGKYKANCPVCQEFLFNSRSASHEMPCGHAIHWECFRQLAAHDSRCPVCKKTAETRERMMPTWEAMAAGVALQPVPPELSRVVNITCNDCEVTDDDRAWHYLGIQCHECSSFNTVVNHILLSGEEAHEYLENLAQDKERQSPRRRSSRRSSIL